MKKKKLLLLIILVITIINFISLQYAYQNDSLDSFIRLAVANSENQTNCYVQVESPTYRFIDGCFEEQTKTYDCWNGSSESCIQGTITIQIDHCTNTYDEYDGTTTLSCN